MSGIFGNGTTSGVLDKAIAAVRALLAGTAPGEGTALLTHTAGAVGAVPRPLVDRLCDQVSVREYGATGSAADDMAAIRLAKTKSSRLLFPRINNQETTYMVSGLAGGDLAGLSISADTGVTISFDTSEYFLFKNIVFETDVVAYFRDNRVKYVFPKSSDGYKKMALPMVAPTQGSTRTAIDVTNVAQVAARAVSWPGSDVFSTEPAVRSVDAMAFAAGAGGAFRGAFVDVGPYETVSALFDNGVAPGAIGVVVRGTGGFTVLYSQGGDSNYTIAQKRLGQPVSDDHQNLTWASLGQGAYSSYRPERSVWSVTRVARDRVIVKMNGKELTPIIAIGDVTEVGFCTYGQGAFTVSGLTVERRTDAVIGAQRLQEIRIFGDSTAENYPGSWDQYLHQLIDGVAGVRLIAVNNFAQAGTTLDQAYAEMQTRGLGNAYHVVVCAGTNNVQTMSDLAAFKALVANVCDFIIGQGRRPVLVIPGMWYTRNQAAGAGQDASNYDQGAPYRMAMERIGYAKKCIVVKTSEELPNPDPGYLASNPQAAILRDNIHQDALGYQLYARAIAQAIINDYCSTPGSVVVSASAQQLLNGTAPVTALTCAVEKSGLGVVAGTVSVSSAVSGTEIIQLPRWCRPVNEMNFQALAMAAEASSVLGPCYLNYSPATGRISIQLAPAGTAILVVGPMTFGTL